MINYQITEGPSKFDLMVSLFDGKKIQFTQKTENGTSVILANVASVEREDGSHSSWNLKIYILESNSVIKAGQTLSAYYSSRTRKGIIVLD
ncbi:MAG: hypothetical protein MUF50_04345 [Planctomycetes bacterium]|jgi:hypothetical protein|nr:hypothetical protein [Planctomycetota bacterium]